MVRRLETDENSEEYGGGLDYVVVFDNFEPPEGQDETTQFLQFLGGIIQVCGSDNQQLDRREHEVSVHVLRLKPRHDSEYNEGDLVQLRRAPRASYEPSC